MNKTVEQIFEDANIEVTGGLLNAIVLILGKDTLNVKDNTSTKNGVSKELLCNERYWLRERSKNGIPIKYRFNNGSREIITYNFEDSSFLDLHDIFKHGDANYNTDITEFDDSILIIDEDNIPYVVEAFRHRFLYPDGNYGSNFQYLSKSLSEIPNIGISDDFRINDYPDSVNDLYNDYSNYVFSINTGDRFPWTPGYEATLVPYFKHPLSFTFGTNGGWLLSFVNINKETFSDGHLKFYPLVTLVEITA